MKILIPFFPVIGANSYPDKGANFSNMEKVSFNGADYWLCDYHGNLPLAGVVSYNEYEASLVSELISINIDNVSNTLPDFDDSDREYTVKENTDCLATGSLGIKNQNFRVPFIRTDTGRKAYMIASITSGAFTITLNFKTGGEWLVNTELLNSELPAPMFAIAEHKFKVV